MPFFPQLNLKSNPPVTYNLNHPLISLIKATSLCYRHNHSLCLWYLSTPNFLLNFKIIFVISPKVS